MTVGTNHFDFRRLVERVLAVVPAGVEVVWQTGWTDTSGLAVDAHVLMASEELSANMRSADLVIAHAGAGSAISAMRAGHRPVLVPRQARHGEHVDNHQVQIAAELGRQGLATPLPRGGPDLGGAGVEAAAGSSAVVPAGLPADRCPRQVARPSGGSGRRTAAILGEVPRSVARPVVEPAQAAGAP